MTKATANQKKDSLFLTSPLTPLPKAKATEIVGMILPNQRLKKKSTTRQ